MKWLAPLLVLFAAGCDTQKQIGSVHVKVAAINPQQGGVLQVDAQDHPALAGARIVIPPGALGGEAPVEVWIDVGPQDLSDELAEPGDNPSPAITFGPPDLGLQRPALITLPYPTAYNEDLVRVWVRAGAERGVLGPEALRYDSATQTLTFESQDLVSFRGGRAEAACSHVPDCPTQICAAGRCIRRPICAADDCGPRPRIPTWTCEDGTRGGFTGRCAAGPEADCQWEVIWCPRICEPRACGPAPGVPSFQCLDGSTAEPVCRRRGDGDCAWTLEDCEPECGPRQCGAPPDGANYICADGTTGGPVCGRNERGACDWQIRQCPCDAASPNDPNCGQHPCDDVICPRETRCDPGTGRCIQDGEPCGNTLCGPGAFCCNRSCNRCVLDGQSCDQTECTRCGDRTCAPNALCESDTSVEPICLPPECATAECGPEPTDPTYHCENGTLGGPTGRCVRVNDSACVWERRDCPRQCEPEECPEPPEPDLSRVCPDGDPAEALCRRDSGGSCAWRAECL